MNRRRESLLYVTVLASAAFILVSLAVAETLLFVSAAMWIIWRPRRLQVPTYFIPLCAFMIATAISLAASPQPDIGWGPVRKVVLLPLGILVATLVNTPSRARRSLAVLVGVSFLASSVALIQFAIAYVHFLASRQLADDPTILARITGFMGHWITFSGEQVLIWCAAVPALAILGRRWMIPVGVIGASLVLSFTRSAWLGAFVGVGVIAFFLPRRLLIPVLLPLLIVVGAASGLIYHRVTMSFATGSANLASGAGEGVTARIKLWKAGLLMIHDHPLFGVGPQRIAYEFPRYYRGTDLYTSTGTPTFYWGHLENNFIQIAAERGLLCFATFLWFLLELYAELLRMLKNSDPGVRWMILSALAALTGFLVSGLAEFNFGDSEVFLLLLFIVSIPYGVIYAIRTEQRAAVEAG
jgi:O-antigen ligase